MLCLMFVNISFDIFKSFTRYLKSNWKARFSVITGTMFCFMIGLAWTKVIMCLRFYCSGSLFLGYNPVVDLHSIWFEYYCQPRVPDLPGTLKKPIYSPTRKKGAYFFYFWIDSHYEFLSPCAVHSLNLLGVHVVECVSEAVAYFQFMQKQSIWVEIKFWRYRWSARSNVINNTV